MKAMAPAEPHAARLSLAAVNGWRGIGAIAIAHAHFALVTNLVPYERLAPASLLVDLFFVLSGLVIAQAYSEKLRRPSAFPEYMLRRFGRIWPVQAACLAVLVGYEIFKLALQHVSGQQFSSGAFAADGPNIISAIPSNLLLIQSLGLHGRETWDFPAWSLSVEFVTYGSFAAFCLIKHTTLRRALTLAAVLASLAVLIFVSPYKMRSTFDYGIFRCFAGFFAGTLCYEIASRWGSPRWSMPSVVEIAGVVAVVDWMQFGTNSSLSFAAPFIFSAFVLAFVGQGGAVSAMLRSKPMQFLAELSFSIYMVHAVVLVATMAVLHELGRVLHVPLFVSVTNPFANRPGASPTVEVLNLSIASATALTILYGFAVFGVALLTYHFVEVPGRSIFARFAKRYAASRAPPAETVTRGSATSVVMP